MELQQVRYFITVAEELNFSKAAVRAYVSQQALSKSIIALERELGVALFDRHSYGLSLTPYGAAFLKKAYHIISIVNMAENELHSMKDREALAVRIGMTAGLEDDFPIQKILCISNKHAGFTIQSTATDDRTIEDKLLAEDFDIGIIGALGNSPLLEYILLEKRNANVIVNRNNPLSKLERVRLEDLKSENFIFGGKQYYANTRFLAACNLKGFSPRIMHQTISINYVSELLSNNMGVLVCPVKKFSFVNGCVSIPFENDPQIYASYLALKKDRPISPAVKILLSEVFKLFPEADQINRFL